MDKQSKKIDKITHQLINEAGLEKPSADFFNNVMLKIEEEKVSQPLVFKPLISKTGWILLFAFTIVIIAILFYNPVLISGSIYQLPSIDSFNSSIPKINLSKTAIYGIGFLSLFLLQIPFLKKQIDQRY